MRLGIVLIIVSNLMGSISVKAHSSDDAIEQIIKSNDRYGANANEYIDKMVKDIIKSKESYEREIKKAEARIAPKVEVKIEKYNQYGEVNMLTGKVGGQYAIHPYFQNRLNNLATAYNKKLNIFSGYRSNELQRQLFNNSDRSGKMVAPPGKSRHNCGLAVDCDGWAKQLTNKELAKFGLYKPMGYEDWHIEPIETKGKSTAQLITQYGLPNHHIVKK